MTGALRRILSSISIMALVAAIGASPSAFADDPKTSNQKKESFQAPKEVHDKIQALRDERINHLLNGSKAYPEIVSCLSSGSELPSCFKMISDRKIIPTHVIVPDILQVNTTEGIIQVFMVNGYENSDIYAITTSGRVLSSTVSLLVANRDALSFKDANIPAYSISKFQISGALFKIVPDVFLFFLALASLAIALIQAKQLLQFFSNPAKRMKTNEIVPFSGIAGNDYIKKELIEIADAIKSDDPIMLGAIPSGILMSGPPGCGKTMMAAAFAKECGLPFYHVAGPDFVEMFVGLGARRVAVMFSRLRRRHSASVLFIDEIDSIGRVRGKGYDSASSEYENTLNKMLQMMDGAGNKTLFRRKKGRVIVIAATNRPELLDPALLRPERLERKVTFQLPPTNIRKKIAEIYMNGQTYAEDVSAEVIAAWTPGFSGADIKSMLNQAFIQSSRESSHIITVDHIAHAIDLSIMGEPSQIELSPEDQKITAWHECAHALTLMLLHGPDRIRSVTIQPRGKAMGMVAVIPEENRYSQSLNDLLSAIIIAVSGRAGEFIKEDGRIERVTIGASQDIAMATDIARDIIERFGFSPLTGMSAHMFEPGDIRYGRGMSEKRHADIDEQVTKIVSCAFTQALTLLKSNRAALLKLIDCIMDKKTINGIEAWNVVHQHIKDNSSVDVAIKAMTTSVCKKD